VEDLSYAETAAVLLALGVGGAIRPSCTARGRHVLPAAKGQGVQLAFRDVRDNKGSRCNSKVALAPRDAVPACCGRRRATVVWEEDDLACAISGTVEPDQLEQISRQI
jgi:hypothetical protein